MRLIQEINKPTMTAKSSRRDLLLELHHFFKSASVFKMQGSVYEPCVRAAFAKSYEFALFSHDDNQSKNSFFWISTLRSICEDLIVLYHLSAFADNDREDLIGKLQLHELHTRMRTQHTFFSYARPQQQVLGSSQDLSAVEDQIRAIWQRNGWPNMSRGVIPPTRQLAEKNGGDIIRALYDYLFRLTSTTVHFSVQGLLRTGWGNLPEVKFSPLHFSKYFTEFGRVYSVYLLCCYAELFETFISIDEPTKSKFNNLRSDLLMTYRWPEMVTFEEMGEQPPEFSISKNTITYLFSISCDRLLDL